jgi:hypothetical protein
MVPTATSCGSLTRAEIASLRAQGTPVAEIASAAGVARTTMYNALSQWGIVGPQGGDHRSRNWRSLYHQQIAAAIASGAA